MWWILLPLKGSKKKQVKPRPKQACCYNPFRLNLPLWHHSNKNNKTYFLLTKIRWYPFSNEGSESNQVFFYSKKTKTSLIHLCRWLLHILVNESDFYHAANRTTKQKNNLSPPHHQDIRRRRTLKCRLPPGNPRASKDLPKPLTSVVLELTQKGVLVFRKKNKVNSWGSVSIICMYIDPLKKLRVSKAQKMCSANSFVDQGRFAGHILEWHILPKHVFFEFLDDPWPSCGDGTY